VTFLILYHLVLFIKMKPEWGCKWPKKPFTQVVQNERGLN